MTPLEMYLAQMGVRVGQGPQTPMQQMGVQPGINQTLDYGPTPHPGTNFAELVSDALPAMPGSPFSAGPQTPMQQLGIQPGINQTLDYGPMPPVGTNYTELMADAFGFGSSPPAQGPPPFLPPAQLPPPMMPSGTPQQPMPTVDYAGGMPPRADLVAMQAANEKAMEEQNRAANAMEEQARIDQSIQEGMALEGSGEALSPAEDLRQRFAELQKQFAAEKAQLAKEQVIARGVAIENRPAYMAQEAEYAKRGLARHQNKGQRPGDLEETRKTADDILSRYATKDETTATQSGTAFNERPALGIRPEDAERVAAQAELERRNANWNTPQTKKDGEGLSMSVGRVPTKQELAAEKLKTQAAEELKAAQAEYDARRKAAIAKLGPVLPQAAQDEMARDNPLIQGDEEPGQRATPEVQPVTVPDMGPRPEAGPEAPPTRVDLDAYRSRQSKAIKNDPRYQEYMKKYKQYREDRAEGKDVAAPGTLSIQREKIGPNRPVTVRGVDYDSYAAYEKERNDTRKSVLAKRKAAKASKPSREARMEMVRQRLRGEKIDPDIARQQAGGEPMGKLADGGADYDTLIRQGKTHEQAMAILTRQDAADARKAEIGLRKDTLKSEEARDKMRNETTVMGYETQKEIAEAGHKAELRRQMLTGKQNAEAQKYMAENAKTLKELDIAAAKDGPEGDLARAQAEKIRQDAANYQNDMNVKVALAIYGQPNPTASAIEAADEIMDRSLKEMKKRWSGGTDGKTSPKYGPEGKKWPDTPEGFRIAALTDGMSFEEVERHVKTEFPGQSTNRTNTKEGVRAAQLGVAAKKINALDTKKELKIAALRLIDSYNEKGGETLDTGDLIRDLKREHNATQEEAEQIAKAVKGDLPRGRSKEQWDRMNKAADVTRQKKVY